MPGPLSSLPRTTRDIVVAFITSRLRHQGHRVRVPESRIGEAGLTVASDIRLDRLATLDRRLMRRYLGRLPSDLFDSVRSELRAAFDL